MGQSLLLVSLPHFSPVLPFARQDELNPNHELWEAEATVRLLI